MGRKKRWTIKKLLTLDQGLQDRINEYWLKNPTLEDELTVIRHLLDVALAKSGIA